MCETVMFHICINSFNLHNNSHYVIILYYNLHLTQEGTEVARGTLSMTTELEAEPEHKLRQPVSRAYILSHGPLHSPWHIRA